MIVGLLAEKEEASANDGAIEASEMLDEHVIVFDDLFDPLLFLLTENIDKLIMMADIFRSGFSGCIEDDFIFIDGGYLIFCIDRMMRVVRIELELLDIDDLSCVIFRVFVGEVYDLFLHSFL